jgi:hypothetical protein
MNDIQTTTPGDPAMSGPLTNRTSMYQSFRRPEAPGTWTADAAYAADSPVPYSLTAKAETLLEDVGSPTTATREADAGGMTPHDPHAESGLFRQARNYITYITKISLPPSDSGIHRLHVSMKEPEPEPEAGL